MHAASQVAKKMGLTLHLRKIVSPREIPAALESLANEVDALWGLADPVVLTPETAEPILLFSFRSRIPFIGYVPGLGEGRSSLCARAGLHRHRGSVRRTGDKGARRASPSVVFAPVLPPQGRRLPQSQDRAAT